MKLCVQQTMFHSVSFRGPSSTATGSASAPERVFSASARLPSTSAGASSAAAAKAPQKQQGLHIRVCIRFAFLFSFFFLPHSMHNSFYPVMYHNLMDSVMLF